MNNDNDNKTITNQKFTTNGTCPTLLEKTNIIKLTQLQARTKYLRKTLVFM